MIGIWLENQTLSVRDDLPIPIPGPAEALIKMRQAGILQHRPRAVSGVLSIPGCAGPRICG